MLLLEGGERKETLACKDLQVCTCVTKSSNSILWSPLQGTVAKMAVMAVLDHKELPER